MALTRNLSAEQEAGKRLSQTPTFKGKNFADPNLKKSYFSAINQEVYGIPSPTFGTGATPSSVTSSMSTGQTQPTIQQATLTLGQRVQTTQAESDEAYKAYQEARAKFTGLRLGAGGFQEAQKAEYEKAMPEISAFNKEEGEKFEELGNLRNELEAEYDKAGIVDWRIKQSLIEGRMNEVRKDIRGVQNLKQQRGLTISDLVSKAVSAYGLSLESAQAAAQMAQEDYQTAFNKYAKELAQQESEKQTALNLAFQPGTLQAGVAPQQFLEAYPEYVKTWEGQSTATREQQAYERRIQQQQLSGGGRPSNLQLSFNPETGQPIIFNPDTGEMAMIGGDNVSQQDINDYIAQKEQEAGMSFAPERRKQLMSEYQTQQPTRLTKSQRSTVDQISTDVRQDTDIKDFITIRDAYEKIKIGAQSAPGGPGDITLIFGYMKLVDPTSVVREGEFATAANAGGTPDKVRNIYNKILKGSKISQKIRNDYLGQAQQIYNAKMVNYDNAVKFYSDRATRSGIDPNLVLRDYTSSMQSTNPLSSYEYNQ